MHNILTTTNVVKKYGITTAVNNVSMTINRGDIYGFVGENGAGKSTMIRLITGVNNPTSGTITLNVSDRRGSVAAIVETPSLHHRLTASENLRYQATMLNINKSDAELDELLKLVGLTPNITNKKPSRNFSLGMKQRLSIAMALLSDPEFILLDEPMNGLDPVGIKEIRELILKLNYEQGTTFLISSHILSELDKIATVYGFISHGKLLKEITAKALHESVQSFTRITLENEVTQAVRKTLENIPVEVEHKDTIIVRNEKDGQKAMQLLVKAGYEIKTFTVVRETIEDYYLQTIKGETA